MMQWTKNVHQRASKKAAYAEGIAAFKARIEARSAEKRRPSKYK